MSLSREYDYYQREKEKIFAKFAGRYIVIVGEKIIGNYPTQLEAIETTKKTHRLGDFMVKFVERDKAPVFIPRMQANKKMFGVNVPQRLSPIDLFVKYDAKQREIITKCCLINPLTTPDYQNDRYLFHDNPNHGRIYKALWDTGATGSVINIKIVQELGLQQIDVENVFGIGGEIKKAGTYRLVISFPQRGAYLLESVVGVPMKDEVIIGMDVISRGDFTIVNGNHFSYSSPSSSESR